MHYKKLGDSMRNFISIDSRNENIKWFQKRISIVMVLLFFCNAFVNEYCNGDSLTIAIWTFFVFALYVKDIKFLLKYSYILFMQLSNILGIYICENEVLYLTELSTYSWHYGSLLLASIAHWTFFQALWFFDIYLSKYISVGNYSKNRLNNTILFWGGSIALIVATVALAHVIDIPAFKLGLDRFRYSEMYLQGMWKIPDRILGLCIPLVGILYLFKQRAKSISFLVIYSCYLFWIGNKFGGFLNLFFLNIPVIYSLSKSDKVLKKTLAVGVVLCSLMVGVVFFHNYLTYGLNLSKNFTYLEQRFAQQGQLWWAQYCKEKDSGYKLNELSDETKTYFVLEKQPREEWNHGIYKVMRNVTPQDIYDKKIASGSRYASATLASIYYYFKDIGLLVVDVGLAFLFWLVTTCYYRDFISGDVIGTIITSKYFIWMHMVATQADFDIIFSYKALFGVIVYLIYKKLMNIYNYKYLKEGM